jgi:RimJ/RimL family protein N-acetyltransferase
VSAALTLRPATEADGEAIWHWRNDPATRAASLSQDEIPLAAHMGWYRAALEDLARAFFIGSAEGSEIGFVRLDREDGVATVSIALAPEARGRGLSVPFLRAALDACPWPVAHFRAVVRPENAASRALFDRLGFEVKFTGNPLVLERETPPAPFVIVLANEIEPDGTPNPVSRARLARAARVMAGRPGAVLVTSGWPYARDPGLTIAHAMALAAARDFRVDPARILESPRSRDTVGDAAFFAADVLPKAPEPSLVTVVTSAAHAPRAEAIFRFVLGPEVPLEVTPTDEPVTIAERARETASLSAFRETFAGVAPGDLPAILARMEAAHPLYNGTVYGPDSPGVAR